MSALRVGSIHLVTDRAVNERQARELGTSFGGALQAALREASFAGDARIDTVRIEIMADALHDRAAMRHAARSVARQVIERGAGPR